MGNKQDTLSPTECLTDLISGNISFKTCSNEEISTHLDIVNFLILNIAKNEIIITNKQFLDIIQVYNILIKILDDIYNGYVIDNNYIYECIKKTLQIIYKLFLILNLSKKVYENSFQLIIKYFNYNDIEIFSYSFICFFNGLRYLEDEPNELISLRLIGPEENTRIQVSIQLDKLGLFPKLISFLNYTSAQIYHSSQSNHCITTSILIFRYLLWILNRNSTSANPLKTKLRHLLLQQQETLFEFIRHPDETLSDASISILTLILKQEERGTALALQVIIIIYIIKYILKNKLKQLLFMIYDLLFFIIRKLDVHMVVYYGHLPALQTIN